MQCYKTTIIILDEGSNKKSFRSVLWHCWLGDMKGIQPVKKLDVGGDDLTAALYDL